MQNRFEQNFEKWLLSRDNSWNPFIRTMDEALRDLPEVPMPETAPLRSESLEEDSARQTREMCESDVREDYLASEEN
jgi:predicted HAD superfamily Cof-like phosphohydrolase